jgi:hypothetical protein
MRSRLRRVRWLRGRHFLVWQFLDRLLRVLGKMPFLLKSHELAGRASAERVYGLLRE